MICVHAYENASFSKIGIVNLIFVLVCAKYDKKLFEVFNASRTRF
jgi:hypothetical protein